MDGLNILALFNGAAIAYFLICGLHIFKRKNATRLSKLLSYTFFFWALLCAKDIVYTFPEYHNSVTLKYIFLFDGWSAVTFTLLLFELTQPGWVTLKKVCLQYIPFICFTALYIVSPERQILVAYTVFLVVYALGVLSVGIVKYRRYSAYIRDNYSDIDSFDLSWLKYILLLFFLCQLFWIGVSSVNHILTDCVYCVSIILLWEIVIECSRRMKPIEIVSEQRECVDKNRAYNFSEQLEELLIKDGLYLDNELTLAELAAKASTNRTYLSDYFNNTLHISFYDYINAVRIKNKSIPLMENHPEYTLEFISQQSGFNSSSTFRRAFMKVTGMAPSRYRNMLAAAAHHT